MTGRAAHVTDEDASPLSGKSLFNNPLTDATQDFVPRLTHDTVTFVQSGERLVLTRHSGPPGVAISRSTSSSLV